MAQTFKVAHRGASGYEPENTLAAFQKAIELNADMIELDVRLCKSGEPVVIHDDTVDRTTKGHGKVDDMTLTELKSLGVPTLTEVLDLADRKIKINIELKEKGSAMPVRAIIEQYVEKGWSYEDFLVSSFHHAELWKMRLTEWYVRLGVLSNVVPPIEFFSFVKTIGAYSVNVPVDRVDKKFVAKAHKNNLKVFVFAANKDNEIEKAKEIGADYICSNFPDKIDPVK